MAPERPTTFDISKELQFLDKCQSALGVPKELLQLMVVDAQGSMRDVVRNLQPWAQEAQAHGFCREAFGTFGLPEGAVKVVTDADNAVMPVTSGGLAIGSATSVTATNNTHCNGKQLAQFAHEP